MPLPPYLTSAASSRAHHALLVKLDTATPQEEEAALAAEVERCRGVLASSPKSSRVHQVLIILLHCASMAHRPLEMDFALLPALKLAEGGSTLAQRRMGYRFLCERLPPGHELHLLLVNTVRKDLASRDDGHVLAALGAIAHLPGVDLGPAVVPLLHERRLLEHDLPAIRQRTIQALSALDSPLSLRDLSKRIKHEPDPAVLSSLLRAFTSTLTTTLPEGDTSTRRRRFDTIYTTAERHLPTAGSPLLAQIIRSLIAIARTLPPQDPGSDELAPHILERTRALLELLAGRITSAPAPPWAPGVGIPPGLPPTLLDACGLVACLHSLGGAGSGGDVLLGHVRGLLEHSSKPNTQAAVLRCLRALPAQLWQDGLEEGHMATIMGGLSSRDSTVRRETLRLLNGVDSRLVSEALRAALESPADGEKALEAVQVGAESLPAEERGRALASGAGRIARALGDSEVWIPGVQGLLGLRGDVRSAFTEELASELAKGTPNATLAVLLAQVATELPYDGEGVVPALLGALGGLPASVQEIVVIALVPLLTKGDRPAQERAVEVLAKQGGEGEGHIAKRCEEVRLVLQSGRAGDVVARARSRALSDVLDAILEVVRELSEVDKGEEDGPLQLGSGSRTARELKYSYDEGRGERSPKRAMGRSMLVEHEHE